MDKVWTEKCTNEVRGFLSLDRMIKMPVAGSDAGFLSVRENSVAMLDNFVFLTAQKSNTNSKQGF